MQEARRLEIGAVEGAAGDLIDAVVPDRSCADDLVGLAHGGVLHGSRAGVSAPGVAGIVKLLIGIKETRRVTTYRHKALVPIRKSKSENPNEAGFRLYLEYRAWICLDVELFGPIFGSGIAKCLLVSVIKKN